MTEPTETLISHVLRDVHTGQQDRSQRSTRAGHRLGEVLGEVNESLGRGGSGREA